jgi:hypothetical protein
MNKFINDAAFMHDLIDAVKRAEKGSEIAQAILAAKLPRLTHSAEEIKRRSESNIKAVHRFIRQTDVKAA